MFLWICFLSLKAVYDGGWLLVLGGKAFVVAVDPYCSGSTNGPLSTFLIAASALLWFHFIILINMICVTLLAAPARTTSATSVWLAL